LTARLGCGQPPPDEIKKEIEALRTDKSIPDAEKKKKALPLLEASQGHKTHQFKENITLVLKYFDQLSPLLQRRAGDLYPPAQ